MLGIQPNFIIRKKEILTKDLDTPWRDAGQVVASRSPLAARLKEAQNMDDGRDMSRQSGPAAGVARRCVR